MTNLNTPNMPPKKYKIQPKDIRFLKAIDEILRQHQGRHNESTLSSVIFGKRNIISKIRAGQRGISQRQLEQFATHFNLDYNFFYRDQVTIHYNAIDSKTIPSTYPPIIEAKGNNSGNIYNSQIHIYLEKAKKIVSTSSKEVQEDHADILHHIQEQTQNLEQELQQKSELLEQVHKEHSKQIIELQQQLLESKKQENEILKKYLAIKEQKAVALEVMPNGIKQD